MVMNTKGKRLIGVYHIPSNIVTKIVMSWMKLPTIFDMDPNFRIIYNSSDVLNY